MPWRILNRARSGEQAPCGELRRRRDGPSGAGTSGPGVLDGPGCPREL